MLTKLGFFLYLCFCIEGGFFLMIVPWSRLWDQNLLLMKSSLISAILQNGYFRGGISGIGIVLFALGLHEAYSFIRGWKSGKPS